jgi:hypothetical protein
MARRVIFTARSPLGCRVTLTRDRWREILRYKHPALAGSEQAVRQCIESPTVIRQSAKDPDVHLHYVAAGHLRVCVVVAPARRRPTIRGHSLFHQEHQRRP